MNKLINPIFYTITPNSLFYFYAVIPLVVECDFIVFLYEYYFGAIQTNSLASSIFYSVLTPKVPYNAKPFKFLYFSSNKQYTLSVSEYNNIPSYLYLIYSYKKNNTVLLNAVILPAIDGLDDDFSS